MTLFHNAKLDEDEHKSYVPGQVHCFYAHIMEL